jgi:phosphomethylpyrimidine synthase
MRSAWIEKRRGSTNFSQLHFARQGVVTEEMAFVAQRENLPESLVMEEVARGRMIIPANINHPNLEPMAIGIASRCKVNANIGASPNASDINEELAKLELAVKYGADTVMDLSTGGVNLDEVRTAIIKASPVPIGTVPVYQALESVHGSIERLSEDDFLHIIEKHCQQGVDYQTIHAGLLIERLPKVKGRLAGIVSARRRASWPSGCSITTSRIRSIPALMTSARSSRRYDVHFLLRRFPASRLPA